MADDEAKLDANSEELCVICATVTIGLEKLSAAECERKLGCRVWQGRGRIYLEIPRKRLHDVKQLRAVENLFVVVAEIKDFECLDVESADFILEKFYHLSENVEWDSALSVWKEYTGYDGEVCTKRSNKRIKSQDDTLLDQTRPAKEILDQGAKVVPRFRVTCTRTHSVPSRKHVFTSMEAAAKFGGGIHEFFGWTVDLGNFDMEVLLNVVDNHVVIGLSLTKESLFRRNIVQFGPTTLRATLAYCMAMAADVKEGEIICDPLCGGGSISLETAINWPCSFNICGDIFPPAPSRTCDNIAFVNKQRADENKKHVSVDTLLWDACHLPIKPNTIDIFITDLPFGKKSGSLVKNWQLYPQVLLEMARVCRRQTGRAVLLTKDKKVMSKTLNQTVGFWKKKYTYWINIGGLEAAVYVLQRTASQPKSSEGRVEKSL